MSCMLIRKYQLLLVDRHFELRLADRLIDIVNPFEGWLAISRPADFVEMRNHELMQHRLKGVS